MQGIYTYIPETNHVCREYSVAAILYLLFILNITLFPNFKSVALLHENFPNSVCSAQYGCFL
jgi:hypothetical protein